MKPAALLALVLSCLALTACTGPDQYPVSGQECGPNDPVKELDAPDCPPAI
ncbi:hypothetical protein [Aestuariicoccus sp. MJ-SS9]|uniref:hypothetical protein n=1 Tax=Aestuariicoccus sp. MJ-SS9 TaxID=3079855 RepID=UPI0029140EFD|nr:hypothetical protein [Aestuariicoccus sp. MJ-SS9]MDU8911614.1 hypothetical protein [Aestuariicoccus sp. MJ-SS9]